MVSWNEFESSEPQLANVGARLLFQYGVGLAYLATVGANGAPRLHPVSPVLSSGRLYVFILPTSPKKADLFGNPKFALQTFPPPGLDFLREGEEFYITGEAHLVAEPAIRHSVISDKRTHVGEDEVLFELKIERVMHTIWRPGTSGGLEPSRRKWNATRAIEKKGQQGA